MPRSAEQMRGRSACGHVLLPSSFAELGEVVAQLLDELLQLADVLRVLGQFLVERLRRRRAVP